MQPKFCFSAGQILSVGGFVPFEFLDRSNGQQCFPSLVCSEAVTLQTMLMGTIAFTKPSAIHLTYTNEFED